MPVSTALLDAVLGRRPADAWGCVVGHLTEAFLQPLPAADPEREVVRRDQALADLDDLLSGSAWDLWSHFEAEAPSVSRAVIDFWVGTPGGRAVLILDGMSLREAPWLVGEAGRRGYAVRRCEVRAAELPGETTPFARSLGFAQRSVLDNNLGGTAHHLPGAFTACTDLPWADCENMVSSHEAVVFWHHWPDDRMHALAGPGAGGRTLAREAHAHLTSDAFWGFVGRLATGRRLVVTGDHGYAACGEFHDLVGDQASAMKETFKGGRSAPGGDPAGDWVPPIDLALTSTHGPHRYVLGRRKWKTAGGYPTLQHGGLSLLEVFVPFLELSK